MSGKIQPGGRIDRDVWKRFRDYVESKHGRTRGVLGQELEEALLNHLEAENPTEPVRRIENDVATVKAQIAELQSQLADPDGGQTVPVADRGPTPSRERSHTHTADHDERAATDDGTVPKPGPKAPKSEKVDYIFEQLPGGSTVVIPPRTVDKKIDDAWGFGNRATDDIRARLFDQFHAEAVSVDGASWQVAIGETPDARDAVIRDWHDDPEEVKIVPEDKFDGFDDHGIPNGVRRT